MLLKAPFPYFGGKSKIATIVWNCFGDVNHYVEPFMGSLAVLLGRPASHTNDTETVNDIDNYLVNFWRAVKADAEQVAYWADYPVSETDLTARHRWLVNEGSKRIAGVVDAPLFYDAQVAGWWVWGICSWIGSGWCDKKDFSVKRPHLSCSGQGINRKGQNTLHEYRDVHRMPRLSAAGQGINRQVVNDIYTYINDLSVRLKRVRITCGDWKRVLTKGVLSKGRISGIFLDPPYSMVKTSRCVNLYNHDGEMSHEVCEWAIEHGNNPRFRIALCGYEGEHTMPDSWAKFYWTANKPYKAKSENRFKEVVWFSPHCINCGNSLY